MEYAPEDLAPRERYKLLAGFVLPRPIGWVTTLGRPAWSTPRRSVSSTCCARIHRSASLPPMCVPTAPLKDTVANIERTGEFVVHMTDEPLAQAMHETSGDFPPEVGEPDYLGLKLAPSSKVRYRGSPMRHGRWSARPGKPST